MSWGSTGFTPIVTYNQPPFGFHEVITPPDYQRCNENPWISTDLLKEELNKRFDEYLRERDAHRTKEICTPDTTERFQSGDNKGVLMLLLIAVAAYCLLRWREIV